MPSTTVLAATKIERRELRAPTTDRSLLAVPAVAEIPRALARNVATRRQWNFDVAGWAVERLTNTARTELTNLARQYTATYTSPVDQPTDGPWLWTGHQPQLFHPGVWIKNFATSLWAERNAAGAIHLIVDNDTLAAPLVRVPSGTPDQPSLVNVAFDRSIVELPFEERSVHGVELWDSFGVRLADTLRGLVPTPLVTQFWPAVIERARATGRIGLAIAQARHRLELAWGARTWELPLSQMCETTSFARFAAALVDRAEELRAVYNDVVRDYRRVYRLRSANHPVPELTADEQATELPFWLWSAADPRRRRAYVVRRAAGRWLSDRQGIEVRLPEREGAFDDLTGELHGLAARGIRLRTRALTTTWFARLAASDLFVHGIGGGKYDELTDAIAARFLKIALPSYAVLSATLQLPIARPTVTPADEQRLKQELRSTLFHAERWLASDASSATRPTLEVAQLLELKRQWIALPVERGSPAQERARRLCELNASLAALVVDRRQELLDQWIVVQADLARRRLLAGREYPFCAFPAEVLSDFFTSNSGL